MVSEGLKKTELSAWWYQKDSRRLNLTESQNTELRMETSVVMSEFLLLFVIAGAVPATDPDIMIEAEGYSASFPCMSSCRENSSVLYRVSGDEDLLLFNSSQPERPQPDGYDVICEGGCFRMPNLTTAHSGVYRTEYWRGNTTEHTSYRLTVCKKRGDDDDNNVRRDGSAVVCREDSTPGHGRSLQLYRGNMETGEPVLVLDTNSSLEPLLEDMRGRLHVDLNNSQVTLSEVMHDDFYFTFLCTTWRGAQCQSVTYSDVNPYHYVLAHEEENLTLPCVSKRESPAQVYWDTPAGDVRLSNTQTRQQEVMYMLNGSQTGDYSLIIPSVSQNHSGGYGCGVPGLMKYFRLLVCDKLSHLELMFSHGESVLLEYNATAHNFYRLELRWYRQIALQPQVLILDSRDDTVLLPEDLRGRVTESAPRHALIISNLTAEDSGLYTWRVFGQDQRRGEWVCSEGSIRLLYRDPFGVDSPFYRAYAPLMGCGLLGLGAAGIWFNLRSRRGGQASGRQSGEGQQSGDENLHDDVEVAEDSV